jgi:hypothetical protein
VITNIPTAKDLNDVALRLHFSAWETLLSIRPDFEAVYPSDEDPTSAAWADEWTAYLDKCQNELQSVCTVIAQSNELALKAKICDVSPFLLLIGNQQRFIRSSRNVDFSDFRTIDAIDLPGAVNTICDPPLSDRFIQTYDDIRTLRNKITHLGQVKSPFDPDEMIKLLVVQYIELWKDRDWLHDRFLFASDTRLAFFHDYKYTSGLMEVMQEWPTVVAKLSSGQFKTLFGQAKNKRRYLCFECMYEAATRLADLDVAECGTAYLDGTGMQLHCIMCLKDYKVKRGKCRQPDCKGTVIGDNADDYIGQCHTCGEDAVGANRAAG